MLAVRAVERLPKLALTAHFGENPRTALERGLVPGVLGMAAGERGEPSRPGYLGQMQLWGVATRLCLSRWEHLGKKTSARKAVCTVSLSVLSANAGDRVPAGVVER